MCNIKNCDSLDFIKRSREQKFDIVFLDPPYAEVFLENALNSIINQTMDLNDIEVINIACKLGDEIRCQHEQHI